MELGLGDHLVVYPGWKAAEGGDPVSQGTREGGTAPGFDHEELHRRSNRETVPAGVPPRQATQTGRPTTSGRVEAQGDKEQQRLTMWADRGQGRRITCPHR